MKTSELTGAALDWAVHQARFEGACHDEPFPSYSTNWAQGGPIIERERINITYDDVWTAEDVDGETQWGPTPLIAAMRCYVASKMGDEVDVPEDLT
jgi:hypothetical protein